MSNGNLLGFLMWTTEMISALSRDRGRNGFKAFSPFSGLDNRSDGAPADSIIGGLPALGDGNNWPFLGKVYALPEGDVLQKCYSFY